MIDYSVERLTGGDVTRLRELNELFADVFEDDENYRSRLPGEEYLRQFLSDEQNIVMVALNESKVIGGLVAYHLPKFEQERSEVYLYDLAVDASHQKQGIGKSLIRNLQMVSHKLGAYVVFVQADKGDGAVEFYHALKPSEAIDTINFDFTV